MKKKEFMWKDVADFVRNVKETYSTRTFTGVYGLPRGGLVLAVMISHYMQIPLLGAPCPGCLIVDDICDSGESLIHYLNNSSGDKVQDYAVVTMVCKKDAKIRPHFFMFEKDKEWIVFPWEDVNIADYEVIHVPEENMHRTTLRDPEMWAWIKTVLPGTHIVMGVKHASEWEIDELKQLYNGLKKRFPDNDITIVDGDNVTLYPKP